VARDCVTTRREVPHERANVDDESASEREEREKLHALADANDEPAATTVRRWNPNVLRPSVREVPPKTGAGRCSPPLNEIADVRALTRTPASSKPAQTRSRHGSQDTARGRNGPRAATAHDDVNDSDIFDFFDHGCATEPPPPSPEDEHLGHVRRVGRASR